MNLQASFGLIVDAFLKGDYALQNHAIPGVRPIDNSTAKLIAANVKAYGDQLAPLNHAVWAHSVYRWMDDHWLLLIDLTTTGDQVSDLTLHAKLHDVANLDLEILSVHVA